MNQLRTPFSLLIFLFISVVSCSRPLPPAGSVRTTSIGKPSIRVGADQLERFIPRLKGKKVAVVANPTSMCGNRHLVDVLVAEKINVGVVFAPEHGFRGEAGAGEEIKGGKDARTGVSIVSLYGNKLKPGPDDLRGVDVILFDIQDVGVRFYTYISTLQLVMEAAADQGIPIMVMDRPNPNGHYVDGPVLDTTFRSFVGMNPIPIVHGLTVGEYAKMLQGEGWLRSTNRCDLTVVPMTGYSHRVPVAIQSRPSPNLRNMNAIYLYPSLCLFEGTRVSLGRGTAFPFEAFGFPDYPEKSFSFKPVDLPGVAINPPYEDTLCYGMDLRTMYNVDSNRIPYKIELKWLLKAFAEFPDKQHFFTPFFNKLAGTSVLKEQLIKGFTENQIRESWAADLKTYKQLRKKYLLYPDFE